MAIVRFVLGVLVGLALAIGIVFAGDALNHALWPPPYDLQTTSPDAVRAYLETAPPSSLIGLLLFWTLAAGAGAFVGAWIARRAWAGWTVAALLFCATMLNLILIPHPWWMYVAAIVFQPLAGWHAAKLAATKPA